VSLTGMGCGLEITAPKDTVSREGVVEAHAPRHHSFVEVDYLAVI
jgi:hypothetical protein